MKEFTTSVLPFIGALGYAMRWATPFYRGFFVNAARSAVLPQLPHFVTATIAVALELLISPLR